jgi:hypothetical protein
MAGQEENRMTTHVQLAAKLLREAATMFRSLGGADLNLSERLDEFAAVYEQVADLVEHDPTGSIDTAGGEAQ